MSRRLSFVLIILLGMMGLPSSELDQPSRPVLADSGNTSPAIELTSGPISADAEGFSMIIASDPQLTWWRGGWDPNCKSQDCIDEKGENTNRNMVAAMNAIESLSRWPVTPTLTLGAGMTVTRPSGVIINGDLTNYFHKKEFELYTDIYEDLARNYQIYPGLGNHDYANNVNDCTYSFIFRPDSNRCAKEAVWYMANLVDHELPNIVNRDLPFYVSLWNNGTFSARLSVTYSIHGFGVSLASDEIAIWQRRGFVIPRGATNVKAALDVVGDSRDPVTVQAVEGSRATCYELYGTLVSRGWDTTSCLNEWPDGSGGSLSYAYEIGDYHFVQLHNFPSYAVDLPFLPVQGPLPPVEGPIPGYYRTNESPGFNVTPSHTWLAADLRDATTRGKHIVINMHDAKGHWIGGDPAFMSSINGQNVVAIFSGHIHETYGYADQLDNAGYTIPIFLSGSAECQRFLLADFHRKYFNVGVVDASENSRPKWIETASNVCDARFVWSNFRRPGEPDDRAADYDKNPANTAPRTFILNKPPTSLTAALETMPALEGAELSFRASAVDPDSDPLTYRWDFGDGTPGVLGAAPTHVYQNNRPLGRPYIVTVTADDLYGGVITHTFQVSVANVPPAVDVGTPQTVDEGTRVGLSPARFSDPGVLDSHSATLDWGDRSGVSRPDVTEANGVGTVNVAHIYADNGVYPVTLCVNDRESADICRTTLITVNNVAPGVEVGSDLTVDEGIPVILPSASFADKGSGDTHTATLDWGDGSPLETRPVTERPFGPPGRPGGMNGRVNLGHHVYRDSASYTVTLCVMDDDQGRSCDTLTVTVGNVAPTATFNAPVELYEGEPIPLALTAPVDVAADLSSLQYAFDCGMGYSPPSATSSIMCPTTIFGTATVKARVLDKDGGATEYTTRVTIKPRPARIGLFDPRTSTWTLFQSLAASQPVLNFVFGPVAAYPLQGLRQPLLCDWGGQGPKRVGVFSDGVWSLRLAKSGGSADMTFSYGASGDTAVCGDWNGDGIDTVGVVRGNRWLLRNSNSSGPADLDFTFGTLAPQQVLVGDWNGDGSDSVGVKQGNTWLLHNALTSGEAEVSFTFGLPHTQGIVGDWDGDGRDTPGVLNGDAWTLRNGFTTDAAEIVFYLDTAGRQPLVWQP